MGQRLGSRDKVSIVLHPVPLLRRINLFPLTSTYPPPYRLLSFSSSVCCPVLFCCHLACLISYNLHMALRVNGARTAIKYQSYRLISRTEPLRSGMQRAAWCPGGFRLANMKSAGSLVTHFPNSRIVLHPRARTK